MSPRRSLRLAAAIATGIFVGLGAGMALNEGNVVAVAFAVALAPVLWWMLRLVPAARRADVAAIIGVGLALRVAVAALIWSGSLAIGKGGFVTGDDADYATLAWAYVRYLSGEPQPPLVPPWWGGMVYLFGTYVYLESAFFAVFGPNVLVVQIVNAYFAAATGVLLYDLTRRLFGDGAGLLGLVLVTFYPSMLLWSALNLKDSLALLLVALALSSLRRFHERPSWPPLAGAFLVLLPMESLRTYLFVGLAILIPAAVALTLGLPLARRGRWSIAALGVSVLLLVGSERTRGGSIVPFFIEPTILETLEVTREQMAVGARTGFQEAPRVRVREGDTFVVVAAPALSTDALREAPCRSVHYVSPNARIVVLPEGAPASVTSNDPATVFVRPGDIVVVGAPGIDCAPPQRRTPLSGLGRSEGDPMQFVEAGSEEVVIRTLAYLPKGLTFVLLAPFPWSVRRAVEYLTVPEMLVWYLLVSSAAWSLWAQRRRWLELAPFALYVGGVVLVLALAEGNVGTLFRHRSMVVPFVAMLAAPSLVTLAPRFWPPSRADGRGGGTGVRERP